MQGSQKLPWMLIHKRCIYCGLCAVHDWWTVHGLPLIRSAARPAVPLLHHPFKQTMSARPPPWRERRGITNRNITKEELTNTPKEETLREESREVSNEEPKETCRVRIYEYRSRRIGTTNPTSSKYPSARQRLSICDTLMDSVIPPQTQGACKWCGRSFSSSTSAGFFLTVTQHLSNNQRCIKKRGGLTATPQEVIPQSSDAADILRLNRARYRARDSLIGSEFNPEFLDAWDRKLREAHSVDSTEDVINQLVEVIRRLRAIGYLPESPHPPGMRPPPSYVVPRSSIQPPPSL